MRAVVTHLNAPRLKPVKTLTSSELDLFLPLQSNRLRYNGQVIALVIADTLLQAEYAASLVTVQYRDEGEPALSFAKEMHRAAVAKKVSAGEPGTVSRGQPESAFALAAVRLDMEYSSASAHHNPIEPGASVAIWDHDGHLTAWNSTQFSYGDATTLGQAFGFGPLDQKIGMLPRAGLGIDFESNIRVIAPLVGGGFGSKGSNASLLLAAIGAKVAGAPVKLVLSREQTYALMPYRSAVVQRVRLGAASNGSLSAILHDAVIQNSEVGPFIEPVGELTPHLYACDHLRTTHRVVRLNINAPGWMRAPGAAPGSFGLECAMDELAEKLQLDPVELRLRNYANVDPQSGHQWSSKSLKQCYRLAGERIGWWSDRDPGVGSMREDGLLIGFGMASAAYRTSQFPSVARIVLTAAGEALVQSAAHEIGQGAISALTEIAAESLGLPIQRVRFDFGDTHLPFAFITAGSATTLSVGSAIKEAGDKLRRDLLLRAITDKASPLYGAKLRDAGMADGRLYLKKNPARSEDYHSLLARHGSRTFQAKAVTGRTFGKSRYGRYAFGAQFAEVAVDEEIGQVRVRRLVGAFGCGRIINQTTARSQLLGGMIWGIGQALFEESAMDDRDGRWVNSNLAEALVPTNSDVPKVEALIVEEDDTRGSALGAKGLGEIGIVGVAAAIANAVHHATGKRSRDLPIKPGKLFLPRVS